MKTQRRREFFDRVVVINLRRRPERLSRFHEEISAIDWPFKLPERFDAVDGSQVPAPGDWKDGGGAWGCMQSHRQVLERAILDGVESLLVLEDDACVRPTFCEEIDRFLTSVPSDWDGLMLGGQHICSPPVRLVPGIVRCVNCQRTHAYAARGRYLRDLYQKWCSSQGHCDHIMGPFAARYQVYAPDPFVFGQERSKSDISGSLNPRKFWTPPSADQPVVLLDAPRNGGRTSPPRIPHGLRSRPLHGNRQGASEYFCGRIRVVEPFEPSSGLDRDDPMGSWKRRGPCMHDMASQRVGAGGATSDFGPVDRDSSEFIGRSPASIPRRIETSARGHWTRNDRFAACSAACRRNAAKPRLSYGILARSEQRSGPGAHGSFRRAAASMGRET